MKLRLAAPADAAVLARIHGDSFQSAWSAAEIETLLAGPGVFGLLAEAGAPLAFVAVRAVADESEVLTLAVDPSQRRSGAARALMIAAMAAARGRGATAMFLEVAVDNEAALSLYGSLGFETAGRRAAYYRRGEGVVDALVLRRTLNSEGL